MSTKNNALWQYNFKNVLWTEQIIFVEGSNKWLFILNAKNYYAPECLLHSNILTFIIRLWNLFTFEYYNLLLVLVLLFIFFLSFLG